MNCIQFTKLRHTVMAVKEVAPTEIRLTVKLHVTCIGIRAKRKPGSKQACHPATSLLINFTFDLDFSFSFGESWASFRLDRKLCAHTYWLFFFLNKNSRTHSHIISKKSTNYRQLEILVPKPKCRKV